MIVETKPVDEQVARWFAIELLGNEIAVSLHYTDKRTGCYLRQWIGFQRTIGQ